MWGMAAVKEETGKRVDAKMFFDSGTGASATMTIETRFFVNEAERNEFGETSSAFLDGTEQQEMADPIGGVLHVAVHHGGGRRDAEFVRRGDDLHPARDGQFVGAELAANAIVENFGSGAGNAAETFVFQHRQIVEERHAGLFNAVGNFHGGKSMHMQGGDGALDGAKDVAVEESVEIARQPALDADFGGAGVPGLLSFADDIRRRERVGVGSVGAFAETAEAAADEADVGKINVAIDNVG